MSHSHITCTNESRCTSYHTYKWVTSHVISHIQMSHVARIHESCLTVISHVQMSHAVRHITHTDESRRTSYHTYKWVTLHIYTSHVSQSYHTYKWGKSHVISHIQMSHVARDITHTNESRRTPYHTYKWVAYARVVSHSVACVALLKRQESRPTHHIYGWVTSHTSMSHVTQCGVCDAAEAAGISPHTPYEFVIPHTWMSHVAHTNESCHTVWHVRRSWSGRNFTSHQSHTSHQSRPTKSSHQSRLPSTYEWVPSHRVTLLLRLKSAGMWLHTNLAPQNPAQAHTNEPYTHSQEPPRHSKEPYTHSHTHAQRRPTGISRLRISRHRTCSRLWPKKCHAPNRVLKRALHTLKRAP